MGSFRYMVRDAFRQLFRHWGVTFFTLLTAAAVFYLVGASALFSLSLGQVAQRVESDQVVRAFADSESDALAVETSMKALPGVAKVRLISPDEGLASLKAKLGRQSEGIAMAGENPLPWTVEVTVKRASDVASVAHELSSNRQVSDFIYAGNLAERLTQLSRLAKRVSVIVVLFSLLVCALVLHNTMRLSIEAKRQEIGVMLLVGATRTHVKGPFVLQGVFLGFFGAALALLALWPSYTSVVNQLNQTLPFLKLRLDYSGLTALTELLLCGGVALGWLSGLLAASRRIRTASRPL